MMQFGSIAKLEFLRLNFGAKLKFFKLKTRKDTKIVSEARLKNRGDAILLYRQFEDARVKIEGKARNLGQNQAKILKF